MENEDKRLDRESDDTKKHMSGLVPVKFYKSGRLLLFLAAGLVVVGIATRSHSLSLVGLGMGLLALYLIFIVPRER